MDVGLHVDHLRRQLALAADAGGEEAQAVVERIAAPIEAAIRLTLMEAVAAAAEEISCELAPGSVEVRLRGRDLDLVVSLPPADPGPRDAADDPASTVSEPAERSTARINLRLPDQLKGRVEQAAGREGLSVNTWLVRAAAAALDRSGPEARRQTRTPQRFTGWAR